MSRRAKDEPGKPATGAAEAQPQAQTHQLTDRELEKTAGGLPAVQRTRDA